MRKSPILLCTVLACTAVFSAACNDFALLGIGDHPAPAATTPPNWTPVYGNDQYIYFWRVGADQSGEFKGRIWREPVDFSSPPTEFWNGSAPNYKCVGCHNVSHDGKYMSDVELTSRTSLDFSVHVIDLTANPPAEVMVGGTSNGGSYTPPAGSYTSWRWVQPGEVSDKFVFTNSFGLQIASVTTGVLLTLTAVTADGLQPSMPSWGANGKIYYAASVYGDPRIEFYQSSSLWVVNSDGTGNQQLYSDPDNMSYYPEVSPDGNWLAFTQTPVGNESTTYASQGATIKLLNLKTMQVLTPNDLDGVAPTRTWATWSSVGNRLTCGEAPVDTPNANGDFPSNLYQVDFDTTSGTDFAAQEITALSSGQFEHIPRWAP